MNMLTRARGQLPDHGMNWVDFTTVLCCQTIRDANKKSKSALSDQMLQDEEKFKGVIS